MTVVIVGVLIVAVLTAGRVMLVQFVSIKIKSKGDVMANNVKNMILADMLTRCLIGEFPGEEEFMKVMENYKTNFSVQVPVEYNENFKDMANDLAKVIGKYFY